MRNKEDPEETEEDPGANSHFILMPRFSPNESSSENLFAGRLTDFWLAPEGARKGRVDRIVTKVVGKRNTIRGNNIALKSDNGSLRAKVERLERAVREKECDIKREKDDEAERDGAFRVRVKEQQAYEKQLRDRKEAARKWYISEIEVVKYVEYVLQAKRKAETNLGICG